MSKEKIIRIVEEEYVSGVCFQVAETEYEFGRHYIMLMNGEPGFHSTDLERVQNYMRSITGKR